MTPTECYRGYVKRVAATYNITEEEAEQHLIVQYYKHYIFNEGVDNDRYRKAADSAT